MSPVPSDPSAVGSPCRSRLALPVALVPVLALVFGLPFSNRLEPVVLGLPFLLFWILAWVVATPLFLGAAYLLAEPSAGKAEP
jgi:hypothetical protein